VTILETNLTGATAVNFGPSNPASFSVNPSTRIRLSPHREGKGLARK
jgi:hypothetical protein